MASFWAQAVPGRVSRLTGASPGAVALALEPLPPAAPAVVVWTPHLPAATSALISAVLDELEQVACGLYPAWLPGAEGLDSAEGVRPAAVRALARRHGRATPHVGHFLMELAERAIGAPHRGSGRPAAQVRAAGLTRVIADSFARPHAALLVPVSGGLAPSVRQSLLAACEWLAQHGGLAVWLAGGDCDDGGGGDGGDGGDGGGGDGGGRCGGDADRVATVPVRLPAHVAMLDGNDHASGVIADPGAGRASHPHPQLHYPPVAGRPHPASAAEQALEAALAARDWAAGRCWNRTWQPHPLASPVRVDLMWEREGCAVEIDGPDHCSVLKYEADRQRDVLLQLAGFAVLRFTNQQVHRDLGTVLLQIEQFLTGRRTGADSDAHQ